MEQATQQPQNIVVQMSPEQAKQTELDARVKANQEHAEAVLKEVGKKEQVVIGQTLVEKPNGERVFEDVKIPVPKKRATQDDVTDDDRHALEVFIKQYMVGAKECALTQAHNACEAHFGYSYRI